MATGFLAVAAPPSRSAASGKLCFTVCHVAMAPEPCVPGGGLDFLLRQGASPLLHTTEILGRRVWGECLTWVPVIHIICWRGIFVLYAVITNWGMYCYSVAGCTLLVFLPYPSFFSGLLILKSGIIHGQCTYSCITPVIYYNFSVPCSPLIGLSM